MSEKWMGLDIDEGRNMRDMYVFRDDILDKIKTVPLLPNTTEVTIEISSSYYEVPVETIRTILKRNRDEFNKYNEVRVLKGDLLKEFKNNVRNVRDFKSISSLTLINRRGLLRIGMFLIESDVAVKVRAELGFNANSLSYKTKESTYINIIKKSFRLYKSIPQYAVGNYRIDLYFPELHLAVECDEYNHANYNKEDELFREKFIKSELECDFIRFNPDKKHFNIGDVIAEIIEGVLKYENKQINIKYGK